MRQMPNRDDCGMIVGAAPRGGVLGYSIPWVLINDKDIGAAGQGWWRVKTHVLAVFAGIADQMTTGLSWLTLCVVLHAFPVERVAVDGSIGLSQWRDHAGRAGSR
ncbi:MAG TPA: hypothetical protein VHS97_10780, partial [Isosphaeraceae bacterium]|nr:hypothetical protein [Isosphaeraceae bacterium]